VKPINYDWY